VKAPATLHLIECAQHELSWFYID